MNFVAVQKSGNKAFNFIEKVYVWFWDLFDALKFRFQIVIAKVLNVNSVKLCNTFVFLEGLTFNFELFQTLVKTFAEKKAELQQKDWTFSNFANSSYLNKLELN
jgi:hypothetical protein